MKEHLVDVEMIFVTPWKDPVLEMPSWTPGSYLIRDYSRHVQEFYSYNKQETTLENNRISKNNWQIKSNIGETIIIKYAVYAFELTARTSYLDNRKAFLSPAGLFMYIKNPHDLNNSKEKELKLYINTPSNWFIFTSMNIKDNFYYCNNFDELVDSPIAMGLPDLVDQVSYSIDGKRNSSIPCTLVIIGDKGNHKIEVLVEDLKKIQLITMEIFGELPYDRYLWILYVVGKGGGGLEHKYSNCSIIPRWYFNKRKEYIRLLSLEAHEHFHTFNIKRIRPAQLGPFDYSNEVYTKLLWVAEGITSFYDKILLCRSGLITCEEYWKLISTIIKELYNTPGRFITSLEESSFNAWIKLYKPDENISNSYVSYYLKGGIIALMLDLEIRIQSKWNKSLDDFFKAMYIEYKQDPRTGYEEIKFKEQVEKHTNTSLDEFWKKYIIGQEEPDVNYYLETIGMKLITEVENNIPWLGIEFNESMIIKKVFSSSPAIQCGICPGDEIIAINGFKAGNKGLTTILSSISDDEVIQLHIFRDDKLLKFTVKTSKAKPDKYKIVPMDVITQEQKHTNSIFLNQEDSRLKVE